jgi:hypothetical protein
MRALAVAAMFACLPAGQAVLAQIPATTEATLQGQVTDVSGAVLQSVPVRVFEPGGETPIAETASDAEGRYRVALPVGEYRVVVSIPAFAPFDQEIALESEGRTLDIGLDLLVIEQTVDVSAADAELIADTTMSLTSTTFSGDELLDLPTNEEDMAQYLLLLAGADITGDLEEDVLANFVIDGFSDGRLPRPDQIAQIIVDPSSLSADGDGRPRIEIVTKPGTGRWRRSVDFDFADESLNALRPGEERKEPRQTRDVNVEADGPIIPNVLEASLEVSMRADDRAGNSLRAITPSAEMFQGVVQPEREQEIELGADIQLGQSHRIDVQFATGSQRSSNDGVGGFTLPERGSNERSDDWMFRVSERAFGADLVNSFRFQVSRDRSRSVPVIDAVAIDVADAFESGGGTNRGRQDDLSVQAENDLRWERGDWNFRWGGELQYERNRNIDEDNFNGTFEFASLHDYCKATGYSGVNCAETREIVDDALAQGLVPAYVDGRGRTVEITGVPTTFTQALGNADLTFSEVAFNTYFQADRRFGRTASLRLGVRYGATNHSRDFLRLDPTVNFQYRMTPDTVISAGARVSFQDFGDYERLLRNDGSTYETELYISAPSFPDPFQGGAAEVNSDTASLWRLGPGYRSPYSVRPQISVTQQVPGNIRLTLSYSGSLGYRQRRTRNVNAPFPGTPLPDEILDLPRAQRQQAIDLMRPFYPIVGNITQIETNGRSVSRSLRVQVRPRGSLDVLGMELSGNVSYTYQTGEDDNDFNNPYAPEWGPTRRDHAVSSGFRLRMPEDTGISNRLLRAIARATYEGTNLNFNVRANTGRLYSIQSGLDLNGDQSTRDRPPGVSRNTEVGPGGWNVGMTFTKEYRLGGSQTTAGGEGEEGRRSWRSDQPRIRFQARINNLLNHAQPRSYVSVLTSPLFGLPTGYTGARTVSLSTSLDF